MRCPFCGMSTTKMSGFRTTQCFRAGIKWIWYVCTHGHEYGHKQL